MGFAGLFQVKIYLLVVNAHTKWPDVRYVFVYNLTEYHNSATTSICNVRMTFVVCL